VYVTSSGTIPKGDYIVEAYGFTDETSASEDVVDPSNNSAKFTIAAEPEQVLAKVIKAEWIGGADNKIAITFDSVVYDRDGEVVKLYRVKSDGSKGEEVSFVPPYSISFKDGARFGNVVYVTSSGTIPKGDYIVEAYGFTDETSASEDVVDPSNNSAKFVVE
jgi:hypothetical protein